VGAYIFTPLIHSVIDQLQPSWRGEYEITDAIQKLLETGQTVKSHVLQGWWLDTGKKEDLLEANRTFLDEYLNTSIQGSLDSSSQVSGRVEIREGCRIENSQIRGPVSIAANCHIKNSFLGPFTSLGENTVVENSSVEYSIIQDNAIIRDIPYLIDSVIGRQVEVVHENPSLKAARLFVGDYSRLEL
jgi:glucose-1-phosphate thymidylyltransferase